MQQLVAPGKVLVSYGPVELSIVAYKDGKGVDDLALRGAEMIPQLLKKISPHKERLKKSYSQIEVKEDDPEIIKKMCHSVAAFEAPSFTPMVAVASSMAGMVADEILAAGASKVIINNGGDIAIRLRPGEVSKVGLAPSVFEQDPSHYIMVTEETEIKGICTSGFGGRSFTKGIASAAIAFSHDNGLADVAATLIGNNTFSPSAQIKQEFAEEIYPDTDLVGHKVTTSVGDLSLETKKSALKNGLKSAKDLMEKDLITGAVVFVQDIYGMLPAGIAQSLQR